MNLQQIRESAIKKKTIKEAVKDFSKNVNKYYIKKTLHERLRMHHNNLKEKMIEKQRVIRKAHDTMKILGFKVERIFKEG